MHRLMLAGSLLALNLASAAAAQSPAPPPSAPISRATAPLAQGGANGVVFIPDAKRPDGGVIVASGELGGLQFFGLDGQALMAVPGGEIQAVDARADQQRTLIAALDSQAGRLRLFARDNASGAVTPVDAREIKLGFSGEGLCLYRSARDNALYAYAMGRSGELDQWLLYPLADGKLDGRVVRRLRLSSEAKFCVADDKTGALYVAQQDVGVWRYDADPEAEPIPVIVDINRLGRIASEVGGLALVDGGPSASFLIAANTGAGDYNVYDRNAQDRWIGAFRLGGDGPAIEEAAGLFATRAPIGTAFAGGVLLLADDANKDPDVKVVSWAEVAKALNLPLGQAGGAHPPKQLALVRPTMETQPVSNDGDAADDPAIWVHPTDPAQSVIIATDKKGGLLVYDLAGKPLQYLPDGKMNNVDLRDGFKLGGETVTLVAASDRTRRAIALYTLDPKNRLLTNVADGVQASGLSDPYGLCLYKDRKGRVSVFVSDPDGLVRQYSLTATKSGKVAARPVRDVKFGTQTEGCVADDETGALYVAEEDAALWKLGADASAGTARKAIARIADMPALKADLEGIGLYKQPKGKGYLVLSSQGDNTYAVFRREGDNAYVGSFTVGADGETGIDGISETDGLDVTSASLGAGLEFGAFVAQDGRNISPPQTQNFKLVPWSAIAAKLGL
ncbi:3-phytase [Caulobacter sp. BE264]|uniref:phytase n=1 Tax=Caulobacter sp. BE264 TaxID=2817724 RepID=UPI002865AE51|nr:phytase [Caulobacter sp. BE264]MDR7230296.1 3-phytase [Caulobacter sp. BE264]